jgi:hypothetical protein
MLRCALQLGQAGRGALLCVLRLCQLGLHSVQSAYSIFLGMAAK